MLPATVRELPVLVEDKILDARGAKFGKTIIERHFRMPDGKVFQILCVDDSGIVPVIIFPLTSKQTILLVHQFRFGINRSVYELPGGCPKPGQSWEDTANAELLEEIGAKASSLEIIGNPIPFNPALENNRAVPVLAKGCQIIKSQCLDETESGTVLEVTIPQFRSMVKLGEIVDAKTIAISYLALDQLDLLG